MEKEKKDEGRKMEPLENKDEDLIEGKNKIININKPEFSFGDDVENIFILDKLKFGQTVYIVSYFPESSGPGKNNPMMHVTRIAHYEVVECRVVSSGNEEVYLHWIGFVNRSNVFVNKDKAEDRLKQLEKEKKDG